MGRAIGAVVWVLAAGVLGTLLGEIGCFLAVAAVMTGCIVYELESIREEKRGVGNKL